jgi:hypothetical protein
LIGVRSVIAKPSVWKVKINVASITLRPKNKRKKNPVILVRCSMPIRKN